MSMKLYLPLLMLICGAQLLRGQQATHFTVNHAVKLMAPTSQSTTFFRSIPAARDLIEDNNYQFAYEDLKGDGSKEAIIQATGITWCGSGGCLTLVLESRGPDYVTLLSVNVGDDLAVMNEKVNGYAALRASFGDGMNMKPKVFILGAATSVKPRATSAAPASIGHLGGISGQITDEIGRPIRSVTVIATNQVTGEVAKAVSDKDGWYFINHLSAGRFVVSLSVPGRSPRQKITSVEDNKWATSTVDFDFSNIPR